MRINDTVEIDEADLEENFIRSSGPGGQNVNKVASAVQLRFKVDGASDLPIQVQARLGRLAGSRLTKDGEIIIKAMTHRKQEMNREEARKRLKALIEKALIAPVMRRRKPMSYNQKKKRVEAKKKRGEVKAMRRKPVLD